MKYLALIGSLASIILISCITGQQAGISHDGDIVKALQKGQNVVRSGQTFNDVINLDDLFGLSQQSAEIKGELIFINCTFEKGFKWQNKEGKMLRFLDDVIFKDCTFKDEFTINDAQFDSRFHVLSCIIEKSIDVQRSTFRFGARITDNKIGNDFIAQYCRSWGDITFFDNDAGRDVLCQGMSIFGKAQLGNMKALGAVDLSSGDFHENFSANYMRIGRKLIVSNCRFHGGLTIDELEVTQSVSVKNSLVVGGYLLKVNNDNVVVDTGNLMLLNGKEEKN